MAKVYWAILTERHGAAYEESFQALADVIEHNARLNDFHRMVLKAMPVAHARNGYAQAFMRQARDPQPDDTFVMLDVDHVMQPDLVEKLAAHDKGVVGALATSRADTPFIPFFQRDAAGTLRAMTDWAEGELAEGTLIGTGAIAIKRWVLETLKDSAPSWFRYTYRGADYEATEDMYFGYECEKAGIFHYCDTTLWIPHCTVAYTTPLEWKEYLKEHPEAREHKLVNGHARKGGDGWGKRIIESIKRTF